MARKSRVSYEKTALVTPHEFLQKSHENSKFLLLGSKGFCKAVLVCRLCALKTSISLGTWFLYRVYPIRKPSVAEILHSLFTYTPVRDDPNDNRCTYNIDNQYCLLLNIFRRYFVFRYKTHIILILSFKSYPIFEHLTSFMEQLLMYFERHKRMETNVVKGHFATKSFWPWDVSGPRLF